MAGPRTGKRGFGTGKGRTKGSKNKLSPTAQELIAQTIAGSMNDTALTLLMVENPAAYLKLINSKPARRALQLAGSCIRVKHKVADRLAKAVEVPADATAEQRRMMVMSDKELVKYHLVNKDGMEERTADALIALYERDHKLSNEASTIRVGLMTPKQQQEHFADLYLRTKAAKVAAKRRKQA